MGIHPGGFHTALTRVQRHNQGEESGVDIKSWICGKFGGGPEVDRDDLPEAAQALYVEPEFPHHALADAVAQAVTMRLLLGM